jgi:hypothetical protein
MKTTIYFLFLSFFILTSCQQDTTVTEPSVQIKSSEVIKVNVCHNGNNEITISSNAVATHQAHGDAVDMDGDGYYDKENVCSEGIDCDDTNPDINPGMEEICDGIDNNCDGHIDEGLTTTYYADADGDGYGDPVSTIEACSVPDGYVTDKSDCDDTVAEVNPGMEEVCGNNIDDNCDGNIDEGLTLTYYADADADGFGDPESSIEACSEQLGYVSDNTDCDDTNSEVNPGMDEVCGNNIDDNCDGNIDEACAVKVGDFYQGGVVVWINPFNSSIGLICSVNNQGPATWGCYGLVSGYMSNDIMGGMNNTQKIVNSCSEPGIAARLSYDLVENGYDDWFLPTPTEFLKLIGNRDIVNTTSLAHGGSILKTGIDRYWTSTEESGFRAKVLSSTSSAFYGQDKRISSWVRSFRFFN